MIALNSEELIAINSIIDNVPIYGLPLIDLDMPEEERVENVISSLQKKEVMKNNELTDMGFILTRLLDDYKKCKTHVFINRLRIALVDDKHVILIEKKENNEYYISRLLKVVLEKKLILSAPFLQKQTKKRFIPFTKEKVEVEELEKELDDPKWTEVMLVQKHDEDKMFINNLYYMSEDVGYLYDYINKEKIQKTPQDIRTDLIKLLEIGGDEIA